VEILDWRLVVSRFKVDKLLICWLMLARRESL
jgi:hypothetical protein